MAAPIDLADDLEKKLKIKSSQCEQKSLYIFGGQNQFAKDIRDVDKLVLSPGTQKSSWTHAFAMEKPRAYFCACQANGKIYILGGRDEKKTQLSSVYEFSPKDKKWTELPLSLSVPRSAFGVAVIGTKIFSVGGFGEEASESIEFLDIEKNKVMRMNAKLSPARWGHAVAAYKEKIYAIGGQWYATPRVSGGRYHHSVQCYNIYSQKWSSCPGMLRRRGYHGVALFEDTRDTFIYAFGGVGGELGNHRSSRLDSVERFNVSSPDIWTLIATGMPAPLSNFGITLGIGCDSVFIVGGIQTLRDPPEEVSSSDRNENKTATVSAVHEYRFRSGIWLSAPNLIFPRRTMCAVSCDSD